jgi:hypothetical protein
MMPRSAAAISNLSLLISIVGLTAIACPPFISSPPTTQTPEIIENSEDDLPDTPEACLAMAERLGVEGASHAELRLALRALERAETLSSLSVDLWVEQARVVFLIAEPLSKEARVLRWLNRGQQLAKRVIKSAPERVEGHYYRAAFLGFRAQLQEVGGLDILPQIIESGRRAMEIDETYSDAAPLMLMGMVLVQAPAWPHGVGDPEEGIELLQRGVEISDYPLNRLILGKGLLIDGQISAGCKELRRVLNAPKRGRWAKVGQRHRQEARVLYNTSRCSSAERTD